ncbi:hypothetical protein M2152_001547 [Microbacteriaceae bacterium SG_E_30_P1]|uniref:Uncharacterized protein n=1 Tax=Antiquaquibacter oligotrophicus TaxID=2880260 RepID=A0ABT6KMX8_9MICO|nr:hypothetical protein [Antiquaquibacter oligotrophicus]MDH6181365.1 hypothetical protein [Antiquaquibacter oligotrophicus]UDF12942.1 hypothetical protein LH407_12380 [Antiquaquibacter oligotrophicus]
MCPTNPHEVHPAEFQGINEAFYAEDPSSYFKTRLSLLVALCDSGGATASAIEAGVRYGGISARSAPGTPEELEGFAAIESLSLLHQVTETVMRLFLAHAQHEPCPALKMAKSTNFREFKNRLANIRDEDFPDLLSEARLVFRGDDQFERFKGLKFSKWTEDGEHLIAFLTDSARILLEDSDPYNSFKHGLGIQASHPSITLGAKDDNPFHYDSPAISYLHRSNGSDTSRWSRTTSMISIEANLAMIVVALEELGALWAVGSRRVSSESITVNFMPANRRAKLVANATDRGVLSFRVTQQFPTTH